MDSSAANKVADQLLKEATERQDHRTRRTAQWVGVVQRLQIGLVTLIFAGIGYTNSQKVFHGALAPFAFGAVFGLAAAAIFPVKRLSGLTVRRSERP